MAGPHHSPAARDAAIADYYAGTDTAAEVAARHGIARSTFGAWIARRGEDDLAYYGGWELRSGVRHPLFPERRSA